MFVSIDSAPIFDSSSVSVEKMSKSTEILWFSLFFVFFNRGELCQDVKRAQILTIFLMSYQRYKPILINFREQKFWPTLITNGVQGNVSASLESIGLCTRLWTCLFCCIIDNFCQDVYIILVSHLKFIIVFHFPF